MESDLDTILDSYLPLVMDGREQHFTFRGRVTLGGEEEGKIVMEGSFNPVHEGHLTLPQAVETHVAPGREILFSLGVYNPEKPTIGRDEVHKRVE